MAIRIHRVVWPAVLGLALATSAPAAAAPFACPRLAAPGDCGDGGPAVRAGLAYPTDVAARPGGGYLIADAGNDAVRAVDAYGRIRTLVDRGLRFPAGIAIADDGRVLVADSGNDRVAAIDVHGRVSTVARGLASPQAVATTPDGTILIADTGHDRVLALGRDGSRRVVAGSGARGSGGDGGPALLARLDRPVDVVAALGGIVVATRDGRLRRVDPDGTIAGLIRVGGSPGIAATPDGGLLATAPRTRAVLRIAAGGGASEVAGGGRCATTTLRRPVHAAGLARPAGVAATADGGVLIADSGAQRVVHVAGGAARLSAGGGLAVPATACAPGDAAARLLARLGPRPRSADSQYGPPSGRPPPSCAARAYWTFNLAYLFASATRLRAGRPFSLTFTTGKPARVRLVARRGRFARAIPQTGEAVAHHARFTLGFPRGLPRAGRYKLRLTARAGGRRECLSFQIRIRS